MLKVAGWTGGLFAIGAGVAHFFPGSWTEPLVLAALGASMLLLGSREGTRRDTPRTTTTQPPVVPVATVRAVRPVPAQRAAR